MRGASHPRHQRRNLVQPTDRVMRHHISPLLGAGNLNPNGGGEFRIDRPGNVSLEAIADHHRPIRGDIEISEEHFKNFGLGFSHPALAGHSNRIEVGT